MAAAYAAAGRPSDEAVMLQELQRRFGRTIHPVEVETEPATSVATPAPPEVAPPVTPAPLHVVTTATPSVVEDGKASRGYFSPLQIIDTSTIGNDPRIIRSSSVRLIPGLEYTSLRFEGMKMRGIRVIQHMLEPPSFRDFHVPTRRPSHRANTSTSQGTGRKPPLSLEELALRLEKIRMPRSGEVAEQPLAPPPSQPSTTLPVISETMARIYAAQGSVELAIECYKILQQRMPEKADVFAKIIDELRTKL